MSYMLQLIAIISMIQIACAQSFTASFDKALEDEVKSTETRMIIMWVIAGLFCLSTFVMCCMWWRLKNTLAQGMMN